MFSTRMTSAALAAAIAFAPAARVAADGKDFIAGAIIGGVVGSQIQKNVDRNRAQQQPVYRAPAQRSTTKRTYRSSIPATQEGRQIQSSLNYFGFNAGTVDGQLGRQSRSAIADYQSYMGYQATGQLTTFEQELLLRSHNRAQAGGDQTFRQIAAHPDGTRGLLKTYRSEIANGVSDTGYKADTQQPAYNSDI
ncbi:MULTISPECIES: peptidoglycan-binding domain-containing protein [unclassified Roseobacter]|uniref:peptidoglycan-binding domain-containing protein n=1 Tax=unclassified Roseobacter TaxID=196798 RepID=UPI0018A29B7E|nr:MULTISPECIES: peptidoglycan-binding domain-containing protein [unclassified Roseobacter]MDW3182213.1 peptidoglycan-binding domain-containing protein [Roseobacter sp.]